MHDKKKQKQNTNTDCVCVNMFGVIVSLKPRFWKKQVLDGGRLTSTTQSQAETGTCATGHGMLGQTIFDFEEGH